MSTGNLNLDLILGGIAEDVISGRNASIASLKRQFPSLSEKELNDLFSMFVDALSEKKEEKVTLVATTPPSFSIQAQSTVNTVKDLLEQAKKSILITGYSLSEYFSDMTDCIINKSRTGVFVKFFVNQKENSNSFDRLCMYKGRFLKVYNYPVSEDKMAALHAKVICVDQNKTLITSANLSYHGQEGNIELGALIESAKIAKQVESIFTTLIFNKVVREL